MSTAFWYWLFMAVWFFFGGFRFYRNRATAGYLYWGFGGDLIIFVLFLIVGFHLFPDPFGTLVHK